MYTVKQLLSFMKQNDASDLYLSVGRVPSFKIHGTVRPAGKLALTNEMVEDLARSSLQEAQRLEGIDLITIARRVRWRWS
jgi:Tfp pilus assembly ATPase PilU